MASGTPTMDNGGNAGTLQRNYGSGGSARDYDGLKQQCDKAMSELTLLRRQHSDTARRCDHAMKELDYYRGQHRAAMNQLEASAQESAALRNKYAEIAGEKQRLERDVQELRQQLSDIHCHQGEDYSNQDNANADTGGFLVTRSSSRRQPTETDSYEALRKRYEELLSAHSAAVGKLEIAQDEVARLNKQCDELTEEINNAVRERNGLKQKCTAAIRQWDIALHERNEYRDALGAAQAQREEAVQELSQAMAVRMKASKDIKRLTDERNSAIQEYALIMSERDTVHKEMEKLSDDLTQALEKTKTLENENKQLTEDKQALSYQMETLRREIASALHDRDKALKECNDLREKFGGYTLQLSHDHNSRDLLKSRLEFVGTHPGENATRKEVVHDSRSLTQGDRRPDTLDQATQEIESLRKALDEIRSELTEATQEAEVSKRRRDWAFSERDKIVLERESIRTLCDRLRKERDRAVSELAAALRDSDEIKKQRNEACRELARLKDSVESRQETHHHRQQFRNHSRDSAIDTDMQEWETEILDMDLSGLASDSSLGLELAGGSDDTQRPNDTGIYVAAIAPGSIADGKLKVNDCIVRVNHLDCGRVSRRMVLEAVRASLPRAHLVVRRRRQGNTPRRMLEGIRTTQLAALHHGLTLETGVYVSKINPGSLAAQEGTISVGDRVLGINNKSMEGLKNVQEAMSILNDDRCDIITITTLSSNLSLNSDDSSFPTKDGHHHHHKMVNRCSQTEDLTTKHYSDNDFIDRRYLVPSTIGHGSVYKVSKTTGGSSSSEKNNTGGTWDIIREKIDLVRGRKHSKDKEDKKKYRNSSPSHDQEQDAIAELDSVIESYHRKSSSSGGNNSSNIPGVLKRSKRRGKELTVQEKNGGTWPKARSQNILQNPTGTIINTRKKERAPISMFLTDSSPIPTTKHCCDRNSNPISVENNLNRHVAYKSMDNHQNFDQDNRLSTILHSDNSIDYSLKPPGGPGGMEKEFLDYYIKKNSGKPSGVGSNKYTTSDSDSNAGPDSLSSVAGGGSNIRPHSQLYPIGVPRYPPFYPHPHPHPHIPRLPSSQSGESFCFEPPTHHWHHAHSPSEGGGVIIPWQHRTTATGSTPVTGNVPPPPMESGTFPRKRENQRFRIPSNPSVAGSIERTSERASPMPTFHVEVLSGGRGRKTHDYSSWNHHRPEPGELRRVHIDKSQEPLGIQIQCLDSGGVFVSTVSEHSLASQVGLQIGDQLLEVCGINMRSATYQLAANVLRQCGNSITMLVQYSPDKYHELDGTASGTSSDEDDDPDNDHDEHGGDDHGDHHGDHHEPDRDHDADGDEEEEEATPRNTPRPQRKPSNGESTLTRSQISHAVSTLQRHKVSVRNPTEDPPIKQSQNLHEPRFLFIETRKCSNLGISLVGGNAVGIFVHSVQPDSLAHNAGLRTGDQILEYNNVDLRHATAEEAAYELAKPADKVSVLAHYNLDRYNEIKDKPGDSLYVRCGFDRGLSDTGSSGTDGGLHLRFNKDDVLYVDNTMFNGVPGNWRAWRLDSEGRRHQCGIIPSKYKVEEELLLRRSLGDLEGRGSTTARRSFFRRKKNTRGGSGPSNRDSKELASFSNHTLGWYSDSGTLHEDNALCSYQRVERLDYPVYRPVLILGPLADGVADKLVTDFPDRFKRCTPEIRHCPQSALDQELADNLIIDFRRKGNYFECSTVNAIKSICDKNCHCILDISVTSVERLHRHQIYPIVLLIKFKSTKQIKEVKDTRYPLDKVSAKAAKEMYEHGLKLEAEYRHRISAVIPAGVNIAYMCTQVKAAVDAEQNKSLWVPFHGI